MHDVSRVSKICKTTKLPSERRHSLFSNHLRRPDFGRRFRPPASFSDRSVSSNRQPSQPGVDRSHRLRPPSGAVFAADQRSSAVPSRRSQLYYDHQGYLRVHRPTRSQNPPVSVSAAAIELPKFSCRRLSIKFPADRRHRLGLHWITTKASPWIFSDRSHRRFRRCYRTCLSAILPVAGRVDSVNSVLTRPVQLSSTRCVLTSL